jgi:hypothetical protein
MIVTPRERCGVAGDRRTAIRAEPSQDGLPAIAAILVGLQLALDRQRRRGYPHDDAERGPGLLLAILAMAHADKSRFGIRRIAHLAAQAAALDLHLRLLFMGGLVL